MPRGYRTSSYNKGRSSYPYSRSYGSSYSYSSSYKSSTRSYSSGYSSNTRSKAKSKDLIWLTDAKENYQLGPTDMDALVPQDYIKNPRTKNGYMTKYDKKEVIDLAKRLKAGHGLPYALRIAMKSEEEFAAPNGPKINKTRAMKDHKLNSEQLARIKPISKRYAQRIKQWCYDYNLYDVQALAAQGMNLRRGIFEPEPFGPKPGEAPAEDIKYVDEEDEEDYDDVFEDEDPFAGLSQEEVDALMAGDNVGGSNSQEDHDEPLQELN